MTAVPPGMIIGLDDTDMPGTPGTNQLARQIADALPDGLTFDVVLRHQLLVDDRIPYTSGNGAASIGVVGEGSPPPAELLGFLRERVRAFAPVGSDPGLCILGAPVVQDGHPSPSEPATPMAGARPAPNPGSSGGELAASVPAPGGGTPPRSQVPHDLIAFARRCQRQPVRREDAMALARAHGIVLAPLGGTGDGVIGALAAVGLRAWGDDGRVVHRPGWRWPDDLSGEQPVAAVLASGVDEIRAPKGTVTDGVVDVGKHLRPSFRSGRVVLFVESASAGDGGTSGARQAGAAAGWKALKLP